MRRVDVLLVETLAAQSIPIMRWWLCACEWCGCECAGTPSVDGMCAAACDAPGTWCDDGLFLAVLKAQP